MGLFDLPATLFYSLNNVLTTALTPLLCLILWGIFAGSVTTLLYRGLSSQEKILQLKIEQKVQQKLIADFEGNFSSLLRQIFHTLALSVRQLGLSLGPALLATIPSLFIIIWVSEAFGYEQPAPGEQIRIETEATMAVRAQLSWSRPDMAQELANGWILRWPEPDLGITLRQDELSLFTLPLTHNIPIIHKRFWWNWLVANPAGYLPDEAVVETVEIGLPPKQFLVVGPNWIRGWMFSFFVSFLLASVGFKFALRIV